MLVRNLVCYLSPHVARSSAERDFRLRAFTLTLNFNNLFFFIRKKTTHSTAPHNGYLNPLLVCPSVEGLMPFAIVHKYDIDDAKLGLSYRRCAHTYSQITRERYFACSLPTCSMFVRPFAPVEKKTPVRSRYVGDRRTPRRGSVRSIVRSNSPRPDGHAVWRSRQELS